MVRNILSVSISPKQHQFLSKNPDINVSQMLQNAIDKAMGTPTQEEIDNLIERIADKQLTIDKWKQMYFELFDLIKGKYPETAELWNNMLMK